MHFKIHLQLTNKNDRETQTEQKVLIHDKHLKHGGRGLSSAAHGTTG